MPGENFKENFPFYELFADRLCYDVKKVSVVSLPVLSLFAHNMYELCVFSDFVWLRARPAGL